MYKRQSHGRLNELREQYAELYEKLPGLSTIVTGRRGGAHGDVGAGAGVEYARRCYLHTLLDMMPTRDPMVADEIGRTTQVPRDGKAGNWESFDAYAFGAYLNTAMELSIVREPSDASEIGLTAACRC